MNLIMLDKLKCRKALSREYDWYHGDLLRGFEHECKVDRIIEEISANWITIPGFSYYELFKKNFQLDLLLVTGEEIFVSEIKGYRNDLHFDKDGVIFNSKGTKIDDPLEQVKVATEKFQDLLDRLGIELKVRYNVIIATEEGVIYGLSKGKPFLLQNQVKDYYTKVANAAVPPSNYIKNKINQLLSYEKDWSHRWPNMPIYSFNGMEKGVYFGCCGREVGEIPPRTYEVTCSHCQKKYKILDLVYQAFKDYVFFFYEKPSIFRLHKWIGCRVDIRRLKNGIRKDTSISIKFESSS